MMRECPDCFGRGVFCPSWPDRCQGCERCDTCHGTGIVTESVYQRRKVGLE